MKPQTREWIEKAEGDWKVARREAQAESPVYDAICFHAQQVVEKYFKAMLEESGDEVPKTHDLILLAEKMPPDAGLDPTERDALAALTAYSVAFRYLGDVYKRQNPRKLWKQLDVSEHGLERSWRYSWRPSSLSSLNF